MWVIFRQNYIGFYKNFLLYTDRCKCSYLQGCKTKILYFIICSLLIVSLNPCASLISITLSFFSLHLSLSLSLSPTPSYSPLPLFHLNLLSPPLLAHSSSRPFLLRLWVSQWLILCVWIWGIVGIFSDDGTGVWQQWWLLCVFVVDGSGMQFRFGFYFVFVFVFYFILFIWVCGYGFGGGGC